MNFTDIINMRFLTFFLLLILLNNQSAYADGPTALDCVKKGCAGAPKIIKKPDGRIVKVCTHCKSGNSCENNTDCSSGLVCNDSKLCVKPNTTTQCPLTKDEELSEINKTVQAIVDLYKNGGIEVCNNSWATNILAHYGLGGHQKCEDINTNGYSDLNCYTKSLLCHYKVTIGFTDNMLGFSHQYICIQSNTNNTKTCDFVVDLWDSSREKQCNEGNHIIEPKDFRFGEPNSLMKEFI